MRGVFSKHILKTFFKSLEIERPNESYLWSCFGSFFDFAELNLSLQTHFFWSKSPPCTSSSLLGDHFSGMRALGN